MDVKKLFSALLVALFIASTVYPSVARADDPVNFANCRLGAAGITSHVIGYDFAQLNLGIYLDWRARSAPPAGLPAEVEYIQMVRVHQVKDDYGSWWFGPPRVYAEPPDYHVRPSISEIETMAAALPGSLWLIGNEIERVDWPEGDGWGGQDEITPELYAVAYHEIHAAIKAADPTARVAIGGIIQPTPLRLAYLDRVWAEYDDLYGPMGEDIDVWNVHLFMIREVLDDWGADIPAGFDNSDEDPTNNYDPADGFLKGQGYGAVLRAHHDMDYYRQFLEDFRTWMAAKGEQDKPLINSEYGILMDVNQSDIIAFLEATFDHMLSAADENLGYPYDENRLLQGWMWYSLNDNISVFDHGTLYDSDQNLTTIGQTWQSYVTDSAHPEASQPRQNLLAANLQAFPNPAHVLSGNSAVVTLQADIANSGNTRTTTNDAVAVSFWNGDPDDPNSVQIGQTQLIEDIEGCGRFVTVSTEWLVGAGEYTWYVKAEPLTGEANTADNVAAGTLSVVDDSPPSIDLGVLKTVDQAAPYTGRNISYTVTVTNAGPDTASGVTVADDLPVGVMFASYQASQGVYTPTTGLWTAGVIGPAAEASLTIEAQVEAGQGGQTITNQATVSAAEADLTPGNDTDSVEINPVANANLAIAKTVSDPTPYTNDRITYTLTVTNYGPDEATTVQVDDQLPAGVSFVDDQASQGSYSAGSGLWNIGSLALSQTVTMSLVATVDAGQGGQSITNEATVSGAEADLFSADDSASVEITPLANGNLAISKSVNEETPYTGQMITYTLVVTNEGPDSASSVTVDDELPAGVSFDSYQASQGSYSAGSGLWTIGSVAADETATMTLAATVDAGQGGQPITNEATVSGGSADTNPQDDTASVTITPVANVDLAVAKTVSDPTPYTTDRITYTLTVTNYGPDTATEVVVEDDLPAGVSFVDDQASQGSYVAGSGLWTIGSLASGETATMTLAATVEAGQGGQPITNEATVSAAEADLVSSNDTDSVEINPVANANLAIAKTVSDPTPYTNDRITYTLTVTNYGPDEATTVQVDDQLPAGVSFVDDQASQGSYSAGSGLWNIGSLALSQTVTMSLVATVDAGQGGQSITNEATVSGSEADLFSADDSASVEITPLANGNLAISKSVNEETPYTGQMITYTLVVTNEGPDSASSVTVDDELPAGVSFDGYQASQGSYSAGSGLWSIGSLAADETATMTLAATVEAGQGGQPITNEATVSGGSADTNPQDDTASVTITPVANVDLAVSKTVNEATPYTGHPITYTLTVTNYGPDTATEVVVEDDLPAGVTFDSFVASQGSYSSATGLWQVGTLAPQSSAHLTITVTVDAGQGSVIITNEAIVSAREQNLYPENDEALALIEPVANADLALRVSAAMITNTVFYTVEVENYGPDSVTEAQVEAFFLWPHLTLDSYIASQGVFTASLGRWDIGGLAQNQTVTLWATATMPANQTDPVEINDITVSAWETDLALENNTQSISVGGESDYRTYLPVILKR